MLSSLHHMLHHVDHNYRIQLRRDNTCHKPLFISLTEHLICINYTRRQIRNYSSRRKYQACHDITIQILSREFRIALMINDYIRISTIFSGHKLPGWSTTDGLIKLLRLISLRLRRSGPPRKSNLDILSTHSRSLTN